MFDSSPVSKRLWDFFNDKYGQLIAPIGVLKSCAVISSHLPYPRLSIFDVAPTRQFKSQTSERVMEILPSKYYIDCKSKFTVFSIKDEYDKILNNKCLMVNDATLLFATLQPRHREHLIQALAELISEGVYHYGERNTHFDLIGNICCIMNMSLESYSYYEKRLMLSTFLERFFNVFWLMPEAEQKKYMDDVEKRKLVKWSGSIKNIKSIIPLNIGEYTARIIDLGVVCGVNQFKSVIGSVDMVRALLSSHACLNGRSNLVEDDFAFAKFIIDNYTINPYSPNRIKIVKFIRAGYKQMDICVLLNKNPEKYQPYVSRVYKMAKARGLVM